MNIKHYPEATNLEDIVAHFSERDGVPIRYVMTSELKTPDVPVDIFYRDTPHPEFGNHYFGLFIHPRTGNTMICDADMIEEEAIACVKNDNGELEYSETHHGYKSFENGNIIDGGRQYIRGNGITHLFIVRDGELIVRDDQPREIE